MEEKELEVKINELPDDLKEKVFDYVNYLYFQQERKAKQKKPFSFKWENAIKDIAQENDSISLQHKSLKWR